MSEEISKNKYQERLMNFFKENLKLVIVSLISSLLILLGYVFYKQSIEKKNNIISEKFNQATILLIKNKKNESKVLLENIINEKHKLYSPLALYQIIDSEIENDDNKILGYFDQILGINSISKDDLNLIRIKKTLFMFENFDENQILDTLNPIINSNSVWKKSAVNLIVKYFMSKGEKLKAEEYLKLLNTKIKK